jgi:alpha/beta superfamily hydrolase
MGARYDFYDREVNRRKGEIEDLRRAIDWINVNAPNAADTHLGAKILIHELNKKMASLARIREKNEVY